jgi:hypothetical protein
MGSGTRRRYPDRLSVPRPSGIYRSDIVERARGTAPPTGKDVPMTTTGIQLQGSTRRVPLATAGALALALLIGATVGSVVTTMLVRDGVAAPAVPVMWDAQKMDAMQARQSFVATPVPAITWDEQKLDAMAGRQLAH